MDTFERQIRVEFLQEAEDIANYFEQGLLKITPGSNCKAILHELFRFAHTLKGSGLAAGFKELGAFAHVVENLLDLLRDGRLEPSKEIVAILLASSDRFKDFVVHSSIDYLASINCMKEVEAIKNIVNIDGQNPNNSNQKSQGLSPEQLSETFQNGSPTSNSSYDLSEFASIPVPVVFICEDEEILREDIKGLFNDNWKVYSFESAEELLEQMQTVEPNLIITDLCLPKQNGLDMVKSIRENGSRTPIIFISGHADRSNVIDFVKLGIFDFFEKPFNYCGLYQSSCRALKEWVYGNSLQKIATLSFRSYMQFTSIDELIYLEGMSEASRIKIKQLEESMATIGSLCLSASRFVK